MSFVHYSHNKRGKKGKEKNKKKSKYNFQNFIFVACALENTMYNFITTHARSDWGNVH